MPNSVGLEVEDVDIFQFANVPFTINAYFKDVNTNQIRTGETSNLKVLLAFEGNASSEFRCKEHHPNLLEVVSNTGIQDNGRATIVVKIKDVSMNHDHKRFVVYLEAYRPQGNNNIIGAITNPITTINYKLMITEAYSAPYIWYKDEGAKDKCIKVNVKLVDSNQQLVTNRQVPLTVNLVYSSGQIVQPSTVLTIFHEKESKALSIGDNGTEVIRFRVNEVSRNHRKQLFHLLVAADSTNEPNFSDISPATSIAFEVKSKRSSDVRKEQLAKEQGGDEESSDENLIPAPQPRLVASVPVATSSSAVPVPSMSTATTGSNKKSRTISSDAFPTTPNSQAPVATAAVPVASQGPSAKKTANIPVATSTIAGDSSVLSTAVSSNPTGTSQGVLDELSLDTPFKALFSLADWTNIAARVLSELKTRNEGADVNETISQLIDTYPVRAQSCLQYLQQFLSMQEQHLVQQHTLIGALHQQQLAFFHTLESLNPVKTNVGNGRQSNALGMPLIGMRPVVSQSTPPQEPNTVPNSLPPFVPGSLIVSTSGGSATVEGTNQQKSLNSTVVSGSTLPTQIARSNLSQTQKSNTSSSSKKRSLDNISSDVAVSSAGFSNEVSASENMVTLIIAKRVALSENTDDFGIPAYTTNTANGVSLLGFYKEMFDTVRDEKVWVFRPLQSYDIFNDNDINLALIEEILDMLENQSIMNDGLFFEIKQFKDSLPRMRQEAFLKLARYEQSRGGLSIAFLDKLMQKGTK